MVVIIELARQLTTGPCFKVGHTVVGHYINVTLMVNSDVMKILSTQHETTFLKVSEAHVFCLPLCAVTHHKHDVLPSFPPSRTFPHLICVLKLVVLPVALPTPIPNVIRARLSQKQR